MLGTLQQQQQPNQQQQSQQSQQAGQQGQSLLQQQPLQGQGQQQQPQQPGQQPGFGGQNGPIPPPPPLNGQDQQLSNILHFLQSEWRRYERDRNEWEVERAELRVRASFTYTFRLTNIFSRESLYWKANVVHSRMSNWTL